MQIKIKNKELNAYITFLQKLELKTKASRGRTKLIKIADKKIQEYNDDIKDIRDRSFKKDNLGKFIQENGQLVPKDGVNTTDVQREADELSNEEAVLILDEYTVLIKELYDALNDYTKALEGIDATVYDDLMDKLDNIKEV